MTIMSEQIDQIALALSKAQGELDNAKKDSKGYGYNYSKLEEVIAVSKPVLEKHGLAIVQLIGEIIDDKVTLTTLLIHSSGQFFKTISACPMIEMKGCNDAQIFGAVSSYLRRYSYQAIIGMVSEDNDASSNGFDKPSFTPKKPVESKPEVKVDAPQEQSASSFRRKKPETSGDDL